MKQITPEQIKRIHTILPEVYRKDPDLKGELVFQFTEDPDKTSTKDMSFYQAQDMIHFLSTGKSKDYSRYGRFKVTNKQHNYILSMCHQIGWVSFNDHLSRLVPDLSILGAWLHKYGYLHKPLMEYTETELPKLVTQFENMVKSKLTSK